MPDLSYQPGIYRKQGGNELVIGAAGRVLDQSGSAAGPGLSPAIWDDCPRLNLLSNPTLGICFFDDFLQVGATTAPWEIVGANGTFIGRATEPYGVARLGAPGTDNDESYVSSNNDAAGMIKADATKNWWYEARVKVSQITLSQGVFVGLAEETGVAADFMTDNTMALKVIDFLGFQIITATDIAAVWQTVMAITSGARAAVSATAATAAVAWTKLGMKSVLGTVTFYVDGVALAATTTSATANFPLDQVMELVFATKCGQATANTLDVDWVSAAQLR